MGRDESEASPIKLVSKGCAAAIPQSNRINVPEFPQSMMVAGGVKFPRWPWIISVVASGCSIGIPSFRIALTVQ
jgi:hypothetical protein